MIEFLLGWFAKDFIFGSPDVPTVPTVPTESPFPPFPKLEYGSPLQLKLQKMMNEGGFPHFVVSTKQNGELHLVMVEGPDSKSLSGWMTGKQSEEWIDAGWISCNCLTCARHRRKR